VCCLYDGIETHRTDGLGPIVRCASCRVDYPWRDDGGGGDPEQDRFDALVAENSRLRMAVAT
jgi:hypothetical protein